MIIGSNGRVRLGIDLPYTRAVIQEGFRIKPATPMGVPRKTVTDVNLMGYHVPKDTQVSLQKFTNKKKIKVTSKSRRKK